MWLFATVKMFVITVTISQYHDYQSIVNPPRLCRRPRLKVGNDLVSLIIAYSSVSCDVRQQLLETQGVVRAGTNVWTPSRLFMKLTFECKCYLWMFVPHPLYGCTCVLLIVALCIWWSSGNYVGARGYRGTSRLHLFYYAFFICILSCKVAVHVILSYPSWSAYTPADHMHLFMWLWHHMTMFTG